MPCESKRVPESSRRTRGRPRSRHAARLAALVVYVAPAVLVAQDAVSDVAIRLELATRPLLGAAYELSPLGEGRPPDPDPRWRLDAFDCTTFVETSLVLAHLGENAAETPGESSTSRSLGSTEAARWLDRIRYSGSPAFENRRHLMAAQWLPGLAALGQIEDITREVAGESTRIAALSLDQEIWESRRVARSLALSARHVPTGDFSLAYLALEDLESHFHLIPPGTLLNVVRAPVPWAPILISHQALLLEKPGKGGAPGVRVVRHASAALGRVADQTPAQFVASLKWERSRPVVGLNLWRITLAPLEE